MMFNGEGVASGKSLPLGQNLSRDLRKNILIYRIDDSDYTYLMDGPDIGGLARNGVYSENDSSVHPPTAFAAGRGLKPRSSIARSERSMIVWLASYPRSGNTLLRTILKQTMGLSSKSDTLDENHHVTENGVWTNEVGVDGILSDWSTFYRQACESDEIILVKTHLPPIDDQPAIYVVRDGRKACLSYLHFDRQLRNGTKSLAEIIAGIDRSGDWSSHYRVWAGRNNTLMTRYEDLVEPSASTLSAIAEVVGYRGPIAQWHNPFDNLRRHDQLFFREGRVGWEGAPEWTPVIDALFLHLHQDLMVQLGYAGNIEATRFPDELKGLVQAARQLGGENVQLEQACSERLGLIERLTSECDLLRNVCSQRLELIDQLT